MIRFRVDRKAVTISLTIWVFCWIGPPPGFGQTGSASDFQRLACVISHALYRPADQAPSIGRADPLMSSPCGPQRKAISPATFSSATNFRDG